jgi:two-component sensor histidine kinase
MSFSHDLNVSASLLKASLARESDLEAKNGELMRQAEEFEHRFFNSLQMVISLLSSQGRSSTPEVADQLAIAINRIVAFTHVHRRLHLLDRRTTVKLRPFLQQLCADLSGVFFADGSAEAIDFQGEETELSAALGAPLGFIVSELVTNSAKHGEGKITIRLQSKSPVLHSLSVSDEGPGLPENFEPANCSGLGMKIIFALVRQINGDLECSNGRDGRGACFVVTFRSQT